MISETVSYGIVMLIENTIILCLLYDLMCRVVYKIRRIAHPHVQWKSGLIFLCYLLCVTAFNLSAFYTCYVNYLMSDDPIYTVTVSARVFERTMILCAKGLLWYYTCKGDFILFKGKI
jgi:hypothetical protein